MSRQAEIMLQGLQQSILSSSLLTNGHPGSTHILVMEEAKPIVKIDNVLCDSHERENK